MNEAEVESWYEEEKERLMERYVLALEKGKDRSKENAAFSRSFKALHKRYESQMRDVIKLNAMRAKVRPAEQSWKGIITFFR